MSTRPSIVDRAKKAQDAAYRKQAVAEREKREEREVAFILTAPEPDRRQTLRALDCRKAFDEVAERTQATEARFDPETGKVTVLLKNGCSFTFPPRELECLKKAPDAIVSDVGLSDNQWLIFGRHNPDAPKVKLVHIPKLLMGQFGTKSFMDRERAQKAKTAKRTTRVKNVEHQRLTIVLPAAPRKRTRVPVAS